MDITSPELMAEPEKEPLAGKAPVQSAQTSDSSVSTSSSQIPTDPKKGIDVFKVIIIILGVLLILSIAFFIYSLL